MNICLKTFALLAVTTGLLAAVPAFADHPPAKNYGYAGAGAGVIPEFEGSRRVMAIPFVNAGYRWGDYGVDFDGLSLRADLLPDLDGIALYAGPVIGYRFGRKNVDDAVLRRLADVDDSIEAGLNAGFSVAGVFNESDALGLDTEWRQGIGKDHEGTIGTFSVTYGRAFGRRWQLNVKTGASWGSRRYLDRYFGVDSADSQSSGLASYTPGSGVKSLDTTASLSYRFSDHWMLTSVLLWDQLVGRAKDSPIVSERGQTRQLGGGLVLSWLF